MRMLSVTQKQLEAYIAADDSDVQSPLGFGHKILQTLKGLSASRGESSRLQVQDVSVICMASLQSTLQWTYTQGLHADSPEQHVGGGHSAMILDGCRQEGHGSVCLTTRVQLSSLGGHALRLLKALRQSQPVVTHQLRQVKPLAQLSGHNLLHWVLACHTHSGHGNSCLPTCVQLSSRSSRALRLLKALR